MHTTRLLTAAVLAAVALMPAACGGSTTDTSHPRPTSTAPTTSSSTTTGAAPVPVESNPPGDIPDNLAFVPYTNDTGGYTFTHPEGWARTVTGPTVTFTDKLNGVTVTSQASSTAPTVATAKKVDVRRLKTSVPAFELKSVEAAKLPSGSGVHIVFRRNSDPDPVTGKVYRDEVEEYVVTANGHVIRMDLFGPVGADNVDAYRTMSQSLTSP